MKIRRSKITISAHTAGTYIGRSLRFFLTTFCKSNLSIIENVVNNALAAKATIPKGERPMFQHMTKRANTNDLWTLRFRGRMVLDQPNCQLISIYWILLRINRRNCKTKQPCASSPFSTIVYTALRVWETSDCCQGVSSRHL